MLCKCTPGVESATTIWRPTKERHQLVAAIDSAMLLALMNI